MADEQTVSIQQSTKGAVSEFLEREGIESIPAIKLVCFLCGALQRYEEEGQLLEPKVVLTHDISAFIEAIPGGRAISIGTAAFDERSGKRVLKECATIAQGGWHIYCQPSGVNVAFGVFSINESPTSLTLAEYLETEAHVDGRANSILIERVHAKEVIVRASSENILKVAFSTFQDVSYDFTAINQFVNSCAISINDEGFRAYIKRLIIRVLGSCHGTIFAIVADGSSLIEVGLSDGIQLSEPIRIYPSFQAYDKSASADGVLELQRIEQLLRGFANSDGVVVFSTRGDLMGYRMFFKAPEGAPPPALAIGGARRRAYEGLKMMLGDQLVGVLFRSQDGVVEFERSLNVS